MKICKQVMALLAGATLSVSVALAAPLAYVPNEKSGTISVIDTAKDEVVAEIRAGTKPRGLAVSADGKRLYVSDQPDNALVAIDLDKRTVAGKIELGESPELSLIHI